MAVFHSLRGLTCAALLIALSTSLAQGQNYQFARNIYDFAPHGTMVGPVGVTTDSGGNVYVADTLDQRIQKFDPNGNLVLVFGTQGDGKGQFVFPQGVAVDHDGNIYVTDTNNARVEKFDHNGNFLTEFGTFGFGPGQFIAPFGITIDKSGNVFVTDGNIQPNMLSSRVEKFDSNGNFLSQFGEFGSGNGQFNFPSGIVADSKGNLFVADANNFRIQKFDALGNFLFAFGTGNGHLVLPLSLAIDSSDNIYASDVGNGANVQKFDNSGHLLSTFGHFGSSNDQFNFPEGVAVDRNGSLFVADFSNNRVQKLDHNGNFLSLVGTQGSDLFGLGSPVGVAVDGNGNLYVTDDTTDKSRVKKFDANADFLSFVGAPTGQFKGAVGAATDSSNAVYIADFNNDNIQKFDSAGNLLLQFGSFGAGTGQFSGPGDVVVDHSDNLYVTDNGNNRVQKFDRNGNFLLQFGTTGSGNGQFNRPIGLGVDSADNVYVVDNGNSRVEKFDSQGHFLFQFGSPGTGNGQLEGPFDVAIDRDGSIFVAEFNFSRVQKFDRNGRFLLGLGAGYNEIPGNIGDIGVGDGQFNSPTGIAIDGNGNVFVADDGNSRVVEYSPANTSVSGTITFEGIVPNAVPQNVTFAFRANDSDNDLAQTVVVPASGAFTVTNLFNKAGTLHVKADKYLASNLTLNLSAGNVSGVTLILPAGDANHDNRVDIVDFGILINAFGDAYDVNDPNASPDAIAADLNGDGHIDVADFALLVNNFGSTGNL